MFKPFLTSFSFFFTKSLEHSSDLYELTRDLTGKTGKKEEDPVEVWERILGERGEEGVVLGFFFKYVNTENNILSPERRNLIFASL